jgi:uncharacterized protein
MKRTTMDILCCPACHGELELTIAGEEGEEIMLGTLNCGSCKRSFPIQGGIPNLLLDDSIVQKAHKGKLEED